MKKITFLNKQGEKLVGILQGEGTKGVIFSHGFTGNKDEWGRFVRIADELSKVGFLVLRFDFSGNGESEGKFEEAHYGKQVPDLLSAIDFMKHQGCKSVGLYGHSMGGAVSILAAAKTKVDAVAVTASVVFPIPERMARYAREWVNKELPPEFLENVASVNILEAAAKIKSPLLIIHGDKDTVINMKESKELYAHVNAPKKLVIIKGADHDFEEQEQAEQVIKEIVSWMKLYLS